MCTVSCDYCYACANRESRAEEQARRYGAPMPVPKVKVVHEQPRATVMIETSSSFAVVSDKFIPVISTDNVQMVVDILAACKTDA